MPAEPLGGAGDDGLVRLLQGEDVGAAQLRLALEQGQHGIGPLDQLHVVGRDAQLRARAQLASVAQRGVMPRETRAPRIRVVVGLSPAQRQRPAGDTALPAT